VASQALIAVLLAVLVALPVIGAEVPKTKMGEERAYNGTAEVEATRDKEEHVQGDQIRIVVWCFYDDDRTPPEGETWTVEVDYYMDVYRQSNGHHEGSDHLHVEYERHGPEPQQPPPPPSHGDPEIGVTVEKPIDVAPLEPVVYRVELHMTVVTHKRWWDESDAAADTGHLTVVYEDPNGS